MAKFKKGKHAKTKEQVARLNQEDAATAVPIRKPNATEWVRCYGESLDDLDFVKFTEQQDDSGEFRTYIIQGKDDETEQRLLEILQPIKCALLVPFVNTFDKFSIWVCKQPGPNTKRMESHASARKAVEFGQKQWVKIYWNGGSKMYQAQRPMELDGFPEPNWPTNSMEQLISLAFEDNLIIEDLDHPIVKRAKGKVINENTKAR
jgi:hypothetical protein